MPKRADKETSESYRVVIRYENHAVRGLAEASELGSIDQLLRNDPMYPLDSIRLKVLDSEKVEDVSTKDAKAVFFVKTFDGDLRHRALHFHEHEFISEHDLTGRMHVRPERIHLNDIEIVELLQA